jgi:hypothetical protein
MCARNKSLPRALEAIVHKATHKDPDERYQSADELASDLQKFLDGKPVSAPPYRYRLDMRETVGSRPGVVMVSAFLCFLVGSGLLVALLSVALMMVFIAQDWITALVMPTIQSAAGISLFAGSVILGYGLLAGWNWARWVVIVLSGGVVLLCLAGFLGMALTVGALTGDFAGTEKKLDPPAKAKAEAPKAEFQPRNFMMGMFAMYSVPLLLTTICAATSFVSLLLPSTAAWFRMAHRARSEHRTLLASLGD